MFHREGATYHRKEFGTREELEKVMASMRVGSIWDDCWGHVGDLWQSIEHALEVTSCSIAGNTITFSVQIGDERRQLAAWVINTVEDAIHAIAGVFNYLMAKIEDVIEWLAGQTR